jgi:hypothetical protein
MQKDEFNDILKQHASGFEMKPASVSFESVMQKRALEAGIVSRNRKRLILYGAAASISVIALAGLLWFGSARTNNPVIAHGSADGQPSATQSDVTLHGNSSQSPAAAPSITSKPSAQESTPSDIDFSEPIVPSENSQPASAIASVRLREKTAVKGQVDIVVTKTDKPSQAAPASLIATSLRGRATAAEPVSQSFAASTPVSASTAISQPAEVIPGNTPALAAAQPIPPAVSGNIPGNGTSSSIQEASPAAEHNPLNPAKDPEVAAANPTGNSEQTVSLLASAPDSAIAADRPAGAVNKGPVWSISALFTPQLFNSVYNANSSANLSWMKQYLENRQQNDRALYSYNTGLKLERKVSDHFSVSAGVLYSTVKFEEIRKVSTVIIKPNERVGMAASGEDTSVEVTRNSFDISFHSMEVPVQVNYTLRKKNIYYQATVGASYSYLFKTRSLVFDETDSLNVRETNDSKNNRLQQHSLMLLGGIHVGVQLSKHLSLYAGPVFRYSVNSLYSKDYIIRQQPYFVGAETGIKYSF